MENLIFSKDNEIESLKDQLKDRDIQNQKLQTEKNDLLGYL